MRARSLQLIAALCALGVVGCMAEATSPEPAPDPAPGQVDVTLTDRIHMMPFRNSDNHDGLATEAASVAPAGAQLVYHGGKVIQNAHVVQVLYGSGSYIPQLTSTSGVNMASAYTQMVTSGVFDWLNEYNTTSPAQTIGRGSFGGVVQIAPAASRNGSTITDASIQTELAAQINGGTLPPANDNAIYMVSFPAGKSISQGGSSSCVAFCAYHGTFKIGAQNVYYGVLPDLTGACASGCGNAPTTFQNQQSVASHELIEAVTDAEVGLATVIGPPLAWYDQTNGEIGDICNAQQGTFTGTDGAGYTIQKEFSNQQNDCITTRSVVTTPDFSLALTPTSATVAPGAAATFTVATSKINNSNQSISLSVSGLPSGVTGSFSPTTVTAGGSATLTLSASASATGSGTFTVTGTAGASTHTTSGSLTVSGGGGGGGNTLTNGVPVSNLSGASGQQALFTIAVPAGQTLLTVKISGGTGDADLYVRAGAAPTLQTFDCRPFISGNNETCTVNNPVANTYFVMLNGFAAYTGVTLVATFGGDTTTALTNNVPVTGLAGATGSQTFFKLTVPAGQSKAVFQLSGGTGDADLYVKLGAKPTTSTFDCRPFLNGNNETCTINNPAAGDYFVMVRGFAAFSGATLVGHAP